MHLFNNRKIIQKMSALSFCLTLLSLHVCAAALSQLSLHRENAPLSVVLRDIERQTDLKFFYKQSLIKDAQPVDVQLDDASLDEALRAVFSHQPYTYKIVNQLIVLSAKPMAPAVSEDVARSAPPPIDVRGRIVNDKGEPAAGVTVEVKGTKRITSTDNNGEFVLNNIDGRSTLIITGANIETYELKMNDKAVVNITVTQKVNDLDEAVVVAYGKTTQRANTGSVTVVKGAQIQSLPSLSVDRSLQGFVPGLLVTQGTGQPGGGVSNFVVRGISTGGDPGDASTVRNPLFVIDGVPVQQDPAQGTTSAVAFNNPMAQLNPADIESISVLKDAAAIALYGSKASNGVILVTTKRGKSGKTLVNFRSQADWATRLSGSAKPLNREQYLELYFEGYRNTYPAATDGEIYASLRSKFPYQVMSTGDTSFYDAPNWLDELYNRHALTLSNNLSLSGGNSRNTFYLNLEYTRQDGVQKNTGYDRKSLTFNYEGNASEWLKVGAKSTISYNVQNFNDQGLSESVVLGISPLNSVRDANGNYINNYNWGLSISSGLGGAGGFVPNPRVASELNINKNISYRGVTNLTAEAKLSSHVRFSTNLGVNFMLTETKQTTHPLLAGVGVGVGEGRVFGNSLRNSNLISTNILRYDRVVADKHQISVTAGHEAQVIASDYKYIERVNTKANPLADQLKSNGQIANAEGITSRQRLLSYFGQLNYGLRNKYFLSGTVRTDGSSLFGDDRKFGSHWSAGLGWIISDENFFENASQTVNYFKLRGSIGSAGNSSAIGIGIKNDGIQYYNNYLNNPAVFPNNITPGNPAIQWEKTFSWNAGAEIGFINNRINFIIDMYRKKTSNLIGRKYLTASTGYSFMSANIGDLQNKGMEVSLNAKIIQHRSFTWTISTNWSTNKNELVKASQPLIKSFNLIADGLGENYNSFYMPVWAGVNPANGRPQWLDEDGKETSDYDAARYDFVGKPQPDGFGAFTNTLIYKGVELAAMIYYQYGFKTYNTLSALLVNDGSEPFLNQSTFALDRWQKPGDIAANPRRLLYIDAQGNRDQGTNASTRYLYDGDFIRLSNLALAYNFPSQLLSTYKLHTLRVFVQGHNLAAWTKYKGGDPENVSAIGNGISDYPLQRSYSVGLNLTF